MYTVLAIVVRLSSCAAAGGKTSPSDPHNVYGSEKLADNYNNITRVGRVKRVLALKPIGQDVEKTKGTKTNRR